MKQIVKITILINKQDYYSFLSLVFKAPEVDRREMGRRIALSLVMLPVVQPDTLHLIIPPYPGICRRA
jgi:hypothetical protein